MLARNSSYTSLIPSWCKRGGTLGVLLVLVCVLTWPGVSLAQLDICGCAGNPNSLGAFDTTDATTYPPGTTSGNQFMTIPLPEDGILIFDSFTVQPRPSDSGNFLRVFFAPNEANTPVTLLVSGDVTTALRGNIVVSGSNGTNGTSGVNGIGGLGGNGGFRGGDGAYQLVNFANVGGAGFGPGGGAPDTPSPLARGGGGTFFGTPELLPMIGGSGGGGGASTSNAISCSAGGGGGGAGAILIAANGTITNNGTMQANGGERGFPGAGCASQGGSGSGGAIRLVADTITGSGSLQAFGGFLGGPGAIRLEAFTNTMSATGTNPVATRAPAPGPVSNPLTPKVAITAVNGQTQSLANGQLLSELPQGGFGAVDVILSVPGVATIDLATSGVPTGTTVRVTAKPRVGGAPVSVDTPVDPGNCDAEGNCVAAAEFILAAGAFVIEAQATFQTPSP